MVTVGFCHLCLLDFQRTIKYYRVGCWIIELHGSSAEIQPNELNLLSEKWNICWITALEKGPNSWAAQGGSGLSVSALLRFGCPVAARKGLPESGAAAGLGHPASPERGSDTAQGFWCLWGTYWSLRVRFQAKKWKLDLDQAYIGDRHWAFLDCGGSGHSQKENLKVLKAFRMKKKGTCRVRWSNLPILFK